MSRFAQGMGARVAGSPTLGRDSTGRTKRLRGWRAGGEAAPGSPRFASRASGSPMSRRPGGRRDCVRMPARAPRKAPAGQGRPTGAAVTLEAPRRSLQPARAPGGATRRGGRPEAALCLPGGRHTRLSARPVYRTGTLSGRSAFVGWTDCGVSCAYRRQGPSQALGRIGVYAQLNWRKAAHTLHRQDPYGPH